MQQNDEKMETLLKTCMPDLYLINELMEEYQILPHDVIRALYLIANIKKISKYGKVSFKIKNSEIISISQEQTLVTEKELRRELDEMRKKKLSMI